MGKYLIYAGIRVDSATEVGWRFLEIFSNIAQIFSKLNEV